MSDILAKILDRKREEIAALRERNPGSTLLDQAQALPPTRGFIEALRRVSASGPAVIAEIKKASPSKGLIRVDFDPAAIAREYEAAGAACLSVLTDEDFFQGNNGHLIAAREACALPLIRKDFLIEELQVFEARVIGADCVLLIAAALSPKRLGILYRSALSVGLDVLVEIHNREELDTVIAARLAGPVLLGINNRNLRTFETRLETTLELLPQIPADYEVVTESGIASAADIRRMFDAGVRRFLIGESLMRQANAGEALKTLLQGL